MKIKFIACTLLIVMLLGITPCFAAETEFNRLETIPTEDCELKPNNDPFRSHLYEKSVVFYGDSLCYARIERGDSNEESVIRKSGYAGRIATKYNMELKAFGVSGSTIALQGNGNNFIFAKMESEIKFQSTKEEREKVDYVILEGGVNDVTAGVPLGTIGDETDNFSMHTFAGAIQYTIKLAKESYPNATVGFLIMYQMPNAENPLRNDIENAGKYMDMIKEACIKWDIPYLDFFHDTKFNNEIFKVNQVDCLTSDGVHMSVKGYDVITPYIAAWMDDPYRKEPQNNTPTDTDEPQDTSDPVETNPVETNPVETDPITSDTGTSNTETNPPEPDKKPELGMIIGIVAATVVVLGGAAVATVLVSKNKKKK